MDAQNYLKSELYDQIRHNGEIFDFLQEASLDGVWYWDLENPENEWMSPSFWRLLGVDPETKEHRAAEWQDIIHPDDLEQALENFQKHLADPSHPYDQLVRYRHADGSTVSVRCRGLAIRDKAGKPIRMLGAHNDITELKKTEALLERANIALSGQVDQARGLAEAKDQFLTTMSHEVRTPLNAIMGLFELIELAEIPEKQRERARRGREAAEDLYATLSNILDASKIEAKKIAPQISQIETSALAKYAETCLEGSIARVGRPLSFDVNVATDMPAAFSGDPSRIKQILSNLIDNAVRFTSEGAVRLEAKPVPHDPSKLLFSVIDTGIGIPQAAHTDVFETFQQVDTGHTRSAGGSGLGLAVSRELARLLGGDLTLAHSDPSGSRFDLIVPFARDYASVEGQG